MSSFLRYILESTACISLFYVLYRLLMSQESRFALARVLLIAVVAVSALIPLARLPQLLQVPVQVEMIPALSENEIRIQNVRIKENREVVVPAEMKEQKGTKLSTSVGEFLILIYWVGVLIVLLLLVRNIVTVLLLLRRATVLYQDGYRILLIDRDVPSFAFAGSVIISKKDYKLYPSAILPHEKAHVALNHFYDLILLELLKIFHWFNPMTYGLARDMKEIHEYQADRQTLYSGIDATQYQLLIIQKCVGPVRFALANSFNHCQIKKRIAMMNKTGSGNAWRWKVATFLPLLAFLLMAFGKRSENAPDKALPSPDKVVTETNEATVTTQVQDEQTDRVVMIKADGNYIGGKAGSLQEVVQKGKEWDQAGNDWIHLQVDESVPLKRVDEVREALLCEGIVHITQSIPHSEEVIFPVGDVSKMVKFSQGSWDKWMENRLDELTNGQCKVLEYKVAYCFVIDKSGKVSDGRILQAAIHPEINAAVEKMLSEIPDWEPAERLGKPVNVLYREIFFNRVKNPVAAKGN
jgi:biopolymer transport protein ExbD